MLFMLNIHFLRVYLIILEHGFKEEKQLFSCINWHGLNYVSILFCMFLCILFTVAHVIGSENDVRPTSKWFGVSLFRFL